MVIYVCVRLKNMDSKAQLRHEWRRIEASTLTKAKEVAQLMPDVDICLEASTVAGGVVT